MKSPSNASGLSQLLKQKTEQDQAQSRALIVTEQEKLLADLQNTYSAGMSSTLDGIHEALKSRLGQMAMLTASEAQTLEKMVADHQAKVEQAMTQHFNNVKKSVTTRTNAATSSLTRLTSSLEAATAAAEKTNQALARSNRNRWLIGVLIGLTVLASISAASWGLMRYLSDQVQQQLATIQSQQQTISGMQTHDLQILSDSNGTYLVLPPNAEGGYTVGGRSAIKLPSN